MPDENSPEITCHWPGLHNEHGQPMLWLGSWLVGERGEEGGWFHSGRGGSVTAHPVPVDAVGIRVRRWMSEGLAPEYADAVPVPSDELRVADMAFDRRQPFSVLPSDVSA